MFHAITWQPKAKTLPANTPAVLTRGVEFGLVQRPGTARFHRTAARLHGAFEALRCEVSSNVHEHAICVHVYGREKERERVRERANARAPVRERECARVCAYCCVRARM